MKITEFTSTNIKAIRPKLESALATVAKELGIAITVGKCSYLDTSATFKVELGVISESGVAFSKDAEQFKLEAPFHGIPAENLFKPFTALDGNTYVIVGWAPRRPARPVLCKREGGGDVTYVFKIDAVKRGLKIKD